jgi:hypothetical protein
MGHDGHGNLIKRDAQKIKVLEDMAKQVAVARINQNFHLAVNEIGIAVVLCVHAPEKGVKTIKHFHTTYFFIFLPI